MKLIRTTGWIRRSLIWHATWMWLGLLCAAQRTVPNVEGDPTFNPAVKALVAHTSWTVRDGAPGNITALAQTSDGYLWLGTPLGLYRFDGIQFASYPTSRLESSLPSAYVDCLASDSQGGLWIGFHSGGISHLAADGTVTKYNTQNRLGPDSVKKIVVRKNRSVWAIGDNRLLRLQGPKWEDYGSSHGLPYGELFTFFFDSRENLWATTRGKLFELKTGQSQFDIYPQKTFIVVDMAEMPDGRLWISDGWHSVRPLGSHEPNAFIPSHNYIRLLSEPNGTLWLARDYRGVSYLPPGAASSPSALEDIPELTAQQTNAIIRDQEGNIWIGTSRGLDRLRISPIETLSGVRLEYYPALVADPSGGVWISDLAHPLLHIQGSNISEAGPSVGSSPIACDQDGAVWLVDPIRTALTRIQGDEVERIAIPDETRAGSAQSISFDRFDKLLVSFEGSGLWRYDGRWEKVLDPALPSGNPLSLARDPQGRVWMGFANSVVVMQDEHGFHQMSANTKDGLGDVLTFAFSDGLTWAAGAEGLSFFRQGAFHHILLKNGGTLRGVSGVVADQAGDFWLNASAGVIRIASADIHRAVEKGEAVQATFLNDRQGLVGTATQMKPAPSATLDKDGRIWFSTSGAVFAITPKKIMVQHSLPVVQIEGVSVDGVVHRDREHIKGGMKLSAALRDLEIDYVGIDLAAPEQVTYRYMLEGEDQGWREVGNRRQAAYGHLASGTYMFRVQATSDGGQWVEAADPVLFRVVPSFYQRWWFHALEAITVLGLLYLVCIWRVHLITGRIRRKLKERSEERVRIARELHDTLLQSVQGLMLRFHFATESLPSDEPARASLRSALSRADDVLLEGRRRVQGLREEMPEAADLGSQVFQLAEELELSESFAFNVLEIGARRPLIPVVQLEMCRIVREALANALQHSDADHVEVTLTYGASIFSVECRDTGKGIPPLILLKGRKEGHWGLIGMRERAAGIFGKLDLQSSRETGTTVTVRVPSRLAYRTHRGGIHWIGRLLRLVRQSSHQE